MENSIILIFINKLIFLIKELFVLLMWKLSLGYGNNLINEVSV
jgi:hypothetical protein